MNKLKKSSLFKGANKQYDTYNKDHVEKALFVINLKIKEAVELLDNFNHGGLRSNLYDSIDILENLSKDLET